LVPPLHNPSTNNLTTTAEERLQVASDFYSQLYTPDQSDEHATQQLIDSLPPAAILTDIDKVGLTLRISDLELENAIDMSPHSKAPGRDGLPFELYRHIIS
ncbi:hypothetical protein K457DRAFT_1760676, partial [Linnemannia elongata AG-77]